MQLLTSDLWLIAPPRTAPEPGIIEVNILKRGQPANVYRAEEIEKEQAPSGIVAIQLSENRNVWRLHKVDQDVYLIYFSRQGWEFNDLPNRFSHWRLPSSLEGTKVLVETDEDHPINKLLKPYLLEDLPVEEFNTKLNELTNQVPGCFWKFEKKLAVQP